MFVWRKNDLNPEQENAISNEGTIPNSSVNAAASEASHGLSG